MEYRIRWENKKFDDMGTLRSSEISLKYNYLFSGMDTMETAGNKLYFELVQVDITVFAIFI